MLFDFGFWKQIIIDTPRLEVRVSLVVLCDCLGLGLLVEFFLQLLEVEYTAIALVGCLIH